MNLLLRMFQYSFIQRAALVGILVSLCAALLGVCLVLKHFSMIGDGLSHVSYGALSVAVAFGFAPLYVSLPVVIIAAFLLLRMQKADSARQDAAIAVLSSSSLAIGITVTALTTGMNTDVSAYMFGSILVLTTSDVIFSVILCLIVLVLYVLSYQNIFAVTFDESFARASGIRTERINMLLSVLTAVTIVVGMQMMGAMLISSLIIFPALTAMHLRSTFLGVTVCAALLSVVCFMIGLILSFLVSIPTGAAIVLVNLAVLLAVIVIQRIRGKN